MDYVNRFRGSGHNNGNECNSDGNNNGSVEVLWLDEKVIMKMNIGIGVIQVVVGLEL